jgi:hypothetical protein
VLAPPTTLRAAPARLNSPRSPTHPDPRPLRFRNAKLLDPSGEPTATVAATAKNPNYAHATQAANPRSVRFGLALSF